MTLQEKDEKYLWHPYTHQKTMMPAVPIVRGEKTFLIDENGNKYIDGISSWWVNIHGHGNKFIAKKLYEQAKELEQVIFTAFTHKPAVELAEKLLKVLPGNFSKVFYTDDGSTATEVAIKLSLQYWKNVGNSNRKKILAFHNSYHGDTFGAMSVSDPQAGQKPSERAATLSAPWPTLAPQRGQTRASSGTSGLARNFRVSSLPM